MLLVHALRVGQVHATSYNDSEVDDYCNSQKEDPLGFPRQTRAQLAGILRHVIAHDVRRGAAKESAHVSGKLNIDHDIETARNALGHGVTAQIKRVTGGYIGSLDVDFWSARTKHPLPKSPKHTIEVGQPYTKKRSAQAIADACIMRVLNTTTRGSDTESVES
ncbi:hypothetical protein F5Y18DRAFT_432892 [Xylariaceae sp. FL1019]|nr:hypothetical protein F5Y18DRAFT_432892 [Xylariaceae sp. FL1019]